MTSNERKRKMQRYLERQKEKLKHEGTDQAINILQVLPLYILARQGYGNIRLERFLSELYRLTDQVKNNAHILEIMIDELQHDKGIKFDLKSGDVINLWRNEGDTRKIINKPKKKG